MKSKWQQIASILTVAVFGILAVMAFAFGPQFEKAVSAQANPTPTPGPTTAPAAFDQAAALAKLREQIKGREQEPADKVFKNIQTPFLKSSPAARLLAVMEVGYSRSLGVNCTHCHMADKWESDDKVAKQTTRDMAAMMAKINGDLLKGIPSLKNSNPVVNCTTCHRGEVKPATNIPAPAKK